MRGVVGVACLMAAALIAGCQTAQDTLQEAADAIPDVPIPAGAGKDDVRGLPEPTDEPHHATDRMDPSLLQAPRWSVGDTWSFHRDDGHWRNLTVVGVDDRPTGPAFGVEAHYTDPPEAGVDVVTWWYDVATLGVVAVEAGDLRIEMECPVQRWFPMTDAAYACDAWLGDVSLETTTAFDVATWSTVATPAGGFDAVALDWTITVQGGPEVRGGDYSPVARHLARFTEETGDGMHTFYLADWALVDNGL